MCGVLFVCLILAFVQICEVEVKQFLASQPELKRDLSANAMAAFQ